VNTCQQHTATLRGAQTISRRLTLTLAVMIVFSLGAAMVAAQVPVVNNPLVPEQKAPGAATFTLTVNGSGFASNAVVKWNGTALTTTFVKSSQLPPQFRGRSRIRWYGDGDRHQRHRRCFQPRSLSGGKERLHPGVRQSELRHRRFAAGCGRRRLQRRRIP